MHANLVRTNMHADRLIPPEELMRWTGSADRESFLATGQEFFRYLRTMAGLSPTARILDVGCGCGRIALPLLGFLDRTGGYDGMDVDARSIEWAAEHISASYPNFRFHHADVHNTTYNATGKVPPYRYRLPFDDDMFDVVVFASVFTHMLPQGLENYLSEAARVLKIGGSCLMTFFLLNDNSAQMVQAGQSHFQFPHRFGKCAVQSTADPESVIGYDAAEVQHLLHEYGFAIQAPIKYGRWCGRSAGNYQDVLVASKRRNVANIVRFVRRMKLYRFQTPRYVPEPRFSRAA